MTIVLYSLSCASCSGKLRSHITKLKAFAHQHRYGLQLKSTLRSAENRQECRKVVELLPNAEKLKNSYPDVVYCPETNKAILINEVSNESLTQLTV